MKVLTRYLLRAHLGPFLFAFGALTGSIVVNKLALSLADLAGKGLPTGVLLRFVLLSLPSVVAMTIPMAVLVATLYTFSRLAAENELLALQAAGVDLRRALLPLLFTAGLLAGGMLWFNNRVLAESNHRLQNLVISIARKSPLFTLREQTVNPIRTGDGRSRYYLQASRIFPATNRLRDVVIYDVSDPSLGRTIYADSGRMSMNAGQTDLLLTLFDGEMREVDAGAPASFQRLAFQRQVLHMPGVANELNSAPSYSRGDREMTIGMMTARIDSLRQELLAVRPTAAEIPLTEMRTVALQREIRVFQVEIHKKYAIAAAILVFVLIGAPLAIRFPRGGIGMVVAVSLTIFALYQAGFKAGETLADGGYVSPFWAMWGTNALLGTAGLVALLRLGRERNSPRA